jgi:methionyl-tRNA formyltransferase
VHRAIIAGDAETGVTIMRVVTALDAGGMMAKAARAIGPDDTSEDVERDLARTGAALLVTVVNQLAAGAATETPQDESLVTYAHRLTKEDGIIDWSWPAARIHNLIRGLHPWPHAFSFVQGKRVIIRRSALEHGFAPGALHAAGTIVAAEGDRLVVATGGGLLRIDEIQAEGKRPMNARDFLAGHRLTAGDRFTAAA